MKAFDRVRHVDPGFRPDHVLTAVVPLSEGTRPKPEQWTAFWNDLEARVAALPGVDAEGLITCLPLAGCHTGNFYEAEGARPRPDGKSPVVLWREASPGYAAAMGLRLRAGRFLQPADNAVKAQPVVVVNETFVRTFWGDEASGVGRRIKHSGRDAPWITIVGVVSDVKHYGLERPVRPGVYLPLVNQPSPTLMLAVHSTQDLRGVADSLREVVRQLDPEIPLYRVRTMDEWVHHSVAPRAALAWILAVFAGLALVLAIGGAYGVATYLVTQQTREIRDPGRARRPHARRIPRRGHQRHRGRVHRHRLRPRAVAAARQTHGRRALWREPADPVVIALVAAVLLATALAANGLPARRAARIDPMRSLRAE